MPNTYDDGLLADLELPFPITFYGSTTSIITPSPNGFIILGTNRLDYGLYAPQAGMPAFSTTVCEPEDPENPSTSPYCQPQGPYIAL